MRIIDRYVIRQVLLPFCLGLLVFTFVFLIPGLIDYAEEFIAKGVAAPVVAQVILTLVPSALALTIPMALLLGLLVGFGRLSADREFVALQACGVSLSRLLRPVGALCVVCWAATSYVLVEAVPSSNQLFREITFRILADQAEGEVRPRVFFEDFPNLVLYVRDIPSIGGGWNGVFIEDTRGTTPAVYLARQGRVLIDREKKTVAMVLEDGSRHATNSSGAYETSQFRRLLLSVNPESMFPRSGPLKGLNEMTMAELRARVAENERAGISTHNELIAIHRKFSIPIACLVFGLIGLALGATNRRDGTLGSFVLGLFIIFAYYIPLYLGPALAKGSLVPAWVAAWLPNLVLGLVGIVLFKWRDRAADRPMRVPLPALVQRFAAPGTSASAGRIWLPLSILDRYVVATYGRILVISALALAAIFYISTFIDLSDKVFKGDATWGMLVSHLVFMTPQYLYYILPLSVLIATLVTLGVMTKNSELVVMKACGISLYRVARPIFGCAAIAGVMLFALEQTVLGPANRRAEAIRQEMRGGSLNATDVLNRRWIVGTNGDFYRYDHFDPNTSRFLGLSVFEFTNGMEGLTRRTYAERALPAAGAGQKDMWRLERGWRREFDQRGESKQFASFEQLDRPLETAAYFVAEQPDARFMSYSQLRDYTGRLRASGFDVLGQQVALARKLSFPFIAIIMTLIAVPFAVTTGRAGAMAGIGVGLGLAMVYWTTISVFAAFGAGGLIAPTLAAWAPNLLFAAGAAYLLLTVRT